MTENIRFFFIIMGILLTMLGVGGIEHSLNDVALLQSLAVSVLGLLLMWVATLAQKEVDN